MFHLWHEKLTYDTKISLVTKTSLVTKKPHLWYKKNSLEIKNSLMTRKVSLVTQKVSLVSCDQKTSLIKCSVHGNNAKIQCKNMGHFNNDAFQYFEGWRNITVINNGLFRAVCKVDLAFLNNDFFRVAFFSSGKWVDQFSEVQIGEGRRSLIFRRGITQSKVKFLVSLSRAPLLWKKLYLFIFLSFFTVINHY